ncbi:MAG TPA: hypothetical protein VHG91_20250, partial [Longimicrobium sp.]|nr:hypothetical protein [Longimicrobium sp.]
APPPRDRPPADRALVLLAAASPEAGWERLAALPLPERDARLLELRMAALGPRLDVRAACPACGEGVEFTLDVPALLAAGDPPPPPYEAAGGGVRMRFRLPDSHDLAAAGDAGEAGAARRLLAARCVVEAVSDDGSPVAPRALPGAAVDALAAALGEVASQADLVVALSCPACGAGWEPVLDPAEFVWAEVAARARRTLREVDALARAYHWSEAEILALSPARRRAYLELVEG